MAFIQLSWGQHISIRSSVFHFLRRPISSCTFMPQCYCKTIKAFHLQPSKWSFPLCVNMYNINPLGGTLLQTPIAP